MKLFWLSINNLISRPLSTLLSLLLLALGVGMISLILQIDRHVQDQMSKNIQDIDMVVGAKGSPLQLILSAVYHIDAPTGNIPLHEAEKVAKNRLIEFGIPLSYGDNYKGYRIVGTDYQYLDHYEATLAAGSRWSAPFEVTVGAVVAEILDLKMGDTFVGSHGLTGDGDVHDEHPYKVVGILEPSNSVLDQLILTSSESVWETHHHEDEHDDHDDEHEDDPIHESEHDVDEHNHDHDDDHEGHDHDEGEHDHHEEHEGHDHEENHEITAMLMGFRSPTALIQIPRMINEKTSMQAAVPAYEIDRLFRLMGVSTQVLKTIALSIMIVSGLSIFISLFNNLKDRRYELALMRTFGASRWQLLWMILQEGLLLTTSGFLVGIFLGRMGLFSISELMESNYHYTFSVWNWVKEEWWLMGLSLGIGLLAALIPALQGFKLNISKTLADA